MSLLTSHNVSNKYEKTPVWEGLAKMKRPFRERIISRNIVRIKSSLNCERLSFFQTVTIKKLRQRSNREIKKWKKI